MMTWTKYFFLIFTLLFFHLLATLNTSNKLKSKTAKEDKKEDKPKQQEDNKGKERKEDKDKKDTKNKEKKAAVTEKPVPALVPPVPAAAAPQEKTTSKKLEPVLPKSKFFLLSIPLPPFFPLSVFTCSSILNLCQKRFLFLFFTKSVNENFFNTEYCTA